MSLVNVNAIEPSTGTDITLGASGDTLTVPSGATLTVSGTMNASSITAGTMATARLGSGTASSSTVLYGDQTYKAEPGGGKVLQVVNATTSSGASSSSSTLSDTGLTAAITPANTANKILIFVSQGGLRKVTGNTSGNSALLVDIAGGGYSSLGNIGHTEWGHTDSTDRLQYGTLSSTVLHSPSSVGVVTYKTQFASVANIAQVDVQDNGTSRITLMELDYS